LRGESPHSLWPGDVAGYLSTDRDACGLIRPDDLKKIIRESIFRTTAGYGGASKSGGYGRRLGMRIV